jgi:hypothetical protein
MASLDELTAALKKADAAGNAADAKVLADAIRAQTAQGGQQAPQESYSDSYVAQGMSGLNEGIGKVLGAPVDLATLLINAGSGGINSVFGANIPMVEKPFLGSEQITSAMSGAGAIKPETTDPTKQFVRRIAEDVGTATVPVLGTVGKAAAPLSTAAKEFMLAVGSGTGAAVAEQVAPGDPVAEFLAQLAGAGTVAGLGKLGRKAVTPIQTSPARVAAADVMKREGVELTAGQQTGSKGLQYAESELGGAKIADITEQQAEQFTSAALKRAGVSGKRATPEVMDRAFTTIGDEFDTLAARNPMPVDKTFAGELGNVWSDYTNAVNPTQRAPIIENTIRDVITSARANGGQINGEAYKALRSRLERMARGTSDVELATALRGLKGAMDDAVERSIAVNNPRDLGAWRQVRSDYRNLLVLERAAQGAGENAAMGIISPAALRTAAQSVLGKRSYVRGKDDFAELAQAGQATMSPLPQSGTSPRTHAKAKHIINPLTWVDAGVGKAILSGPGKRYLSNRYLKAPRGKATGVGAGSAVVTEQVSPDKRLSKAQERFLELLRPNAPIEITIRGGGGN